MDSFWTFTEEQLSIPEKLTFIAKEPVSMMVMDFRRNEGEKPNFVMTCRVLTGEHKDKIFKMYMYKSSRGTVEFMLMYATKDVLKSGTFQGSTLIGKKFTCIPDVLKEFNGKMYQNFNVYAKIEEVASNTQAATKPADDLPF